MMHEAYQKLRIVAAQAYSKIWANRHKNVPGKWHPDGMLGGERSWDNIPMKWLLEKLQEEVDELGVEARKAMWTDDPQVLQDLIKEAGDVLAMAMMVADRAGCFDKMSQPKVVTLCGSTRFKEEFIRAQFEETMKGHVVISVGWFSHADKEVYAVSPEEKTMLDALHKRKIDLADEILVINPGNYIGESTRSEIEYAIATGKDIRYTVDPSLTSGPHTTGA